LTEINDLYPIIQDATKHDYGGDGTNLTFDSFVQALCSCTEFTKIEKLVSELNNEDSDLNALLHDVPFKPMRCDPGIIDF